MSFLAAVFLPKLVRIGVFDGTDDRLILKAFRNYGGNDFKNLADMVRHLPKQIEHLSPIRHACFAVADKIDPSSSALWAHRGWEITPNAISVMLDIPVTNVSLVEHCLSLGAGTPRLNLQHHLLGETWDAPGPTLTVSPGLDSLLISARDKDGNIRQISADKVWAPKPDTIGVGGVRNSDVRDYICNELGGRDVTSNDMLSYRGIERIYRALHSKIANTDERREKDLTAPQIIHGHSRLGNIARRWFWSMVADECHELVEAEACRKIFLSGDTVKGLHFFRETFVNYYNRSTRGNDIVAGQGLEPVQISVDRDPLTALRGAGMIAHRDFVYQRTHTFPSPGIDIEIAREAGPGIKPDGLHPY